MICRAIRDRLRHEIQKMYSSCDNAFGAIDFSGQGIVTEDAFLSSIPVSRVPYTKD